ncbi:alkaline shock response membrane anchor protein AmaP [Enterococcus plantarum]|uniref:alkaline shock response membrane anchor protein AmaP n=1 Tax=Enterococcus plantarum TaxID=1077675 RepID=UPI001A8D27F5|nr:alkaline shock response membrane anchor protein AmaP [Enterococcus plantarum]MBO0422382.1 alkaline shock response membrane anchor protein AmaP [Enterococcus plantarum]
MKRLLKIVFALIILLLFFGTLGLLSQLIDIPWLSYQVDWLLYIYPGLFIFFEWMLLILGGLMLLTLIVVFLVSGGRKRLIVKEGKNQIEIPKSTVEQLVKEAYSTIIHPDKTKLTVKIKGKEKVAVKLNVDVRSKERFQALGEEIKETIQSTLNSALESIDSHVTVQLREKESTEPTAFGKKQSRVV